MVFIGSREPIETHFETLGISDEIRVATIAFDEMTILDFCVFVVVVLASSVTTQKISWYVTINWRFVRKHPKKTTLAGTHREAQIY